MSFPPFISALKLNVSMGTSPNVQTFEQPIHPSELSGTTTNSVLITNSDLLNAFNSQPLGTTFTPSIITTYEGFPSGNSVSKESSSPFVPRQFTTNLSFQNIPDLNALTAPFELIVSTNSPAPLYFSSNNTSVVTVSSSGLVTVQGVGMATITITQPALGGSVYAAAVPVSRQLVVKAVPNLSLASITNKLTTASPFSLSVSSLSGGALTYSSSAAGVATVNSIGLVTLVGAGTTTITVSQAASLDGVYAADSVLQQLVVSMPAAPIQTGFSVLTGNSDFAGLDFDSDMTTLFTDNDEFISMITMPNSNFMFNGAAYAILYASSNGWFSFGTNVSEVSFGKNNQLPINTFRFFGQDHQSTGSYKFLANNTRLLFKLTGYLYGYTTKTFTIKVIIEQSGEIRTNYTLASTFTSDTIIIGFVGNNSYDTSDDIFLNFSDVTFNGSTTLNLFSLLNGKNILFIPIAVWSQLGQDIDGKALNERSGHSVSLSSDGNTVAIGAPYNLYNPYAGHVRVYDWNTITTPNRWTQRGPDIDGDGAGDQSGYSVSLSSDGNTVAIGAPYNSGAGPYAGHVRVYNWNGSSWTKRGLDIDGEAAYDHCGWSVSLSSDGNTLAIGEPYNNGNSSYAGHVRVYDWNESSWTKRGSDIYGEAAYDYSGWSVSLSSDGNTVAIGAIRNGVADSYAGYVRVYDWNALSVSWAKRGSGIVGEAADDQSGYSVSLSSDGNTLAIGAPYNGDGGSYAGHVRVYDWNALSVSWAKRGGDIDGEAAYDYSGYSVSLSSDGNTVAIGAHGNDGASSNAGHVRVYDWNTASVSWTKRGSDIDGEAVGDNSGYSVSLSSDGNTVAIGAPYNDDSFANAGHMRVFKYQ